MRGGSVRTVVHALTGLGTMQEYAALLRSRIGQFGFLWDQYFLNLYERRRVVKRILATVLALLCIVAYFLENAGAKEVHPERVSPVARLAHSGDIKGTLKCIDSNPVVGALVYIPGKSLMVKTDSEGAFRLFNVPWGVYQLKVEIPGLPIVTEDGVRVRPKRVTKLDLEVECDCIDKDADGYGEGPQCLGSDCDDDDFSVNPGAQELCDGIDNNCNKQVDEGETCGGS